MLRYKDEVAVVKPLGESAVDIKDRRVLIDLKEIKDVSHDNLNAFIAVCFDTPNACILMSYATRGSLQDVLLDDSVNLSWDFKISLATDLANGMKYLHTTAIGVNFYQKSVYTIKAKYVFIYLLIL